MRARIPSVVIGPDRPAQLASYVDVDYRTGSVVAACVGFEAWDAPAPSFERTLPFAEAPAEYESGQFYRRELPYLLELLKALPAPPALVVIDGFVGSMAADPGSVRIWPKRWLAPRPSSVSPSARFAAQPTRRSSGAVAARSRCS